MGRDDMNEMNNFGLTEKEQDMNLHDYNHALFQNMMYFMDMSWEINMLTGTVVILQDRNEPERSGTELSYREVFQDYIDNRVSESERPVFEQYMSVKNLKKLEKETSFDVRLYRKNDSWELHRIVLTPAIDQFGKPYCVYLGARNLQAEVSCGLGESHNREQFWLAAMSGALLICNVNLTKNRIEEEFYEMCDGEQYPMLQMMGLTAPCSFDEFVKRWSEQKVFEESRENFLRTYDREYMLDAYHRGERRLETEFDTILGRERRITLRSTTLLVEDKINGDILAIMNAKDITAGKQAEARQQEALREAYEAANRANSAKSEFLTQISHDIRTPMNAIIGMTAIAEQHQDNTARVAECLKKISVSSKYLLSLVDEMLDMSMIESGKMTLQEEEINLVELFENLEIILKPYARENGHELSVKILHIEHEKVFGDRRRIDQIMMNLVDNAAKYTEEKGKISITLEEKPTSKQDIGCYEIVVEDNGIGMDPEVLEHLFEPFVRAKDYRVKKVHGSGLGMAITNNIVRMMNGGIYVKSEPEKGTKVTVKIFLKLSENEAAVFPQLADAAVLVVNSDEALCRAACETLAGLGIRSEWVMTDREALELIARRCREKDGYRAVILEREMLEDAALVDVIREIHGLAGSSAAIVVSSKSDWSDIETEARTAGAAAFITKPDSKSRLTHLFQVITGERAEEDEKSPIQSLSEKDFSGYRALMVEDNESNADIIREILEMVGMEIHQAWNGREAIEMMAAAEDWYYNIVFMDIQMPVMDGYEAVKAIRSLDRSYTKEVPILAMSANAFAEDIQASLAAGMNEHISKPIDLKKLEESLCRWLPQRG